MLSKARGAREYDVEETPRRHEHIVEDTNIFKGQRYNKKYIYREREICIPHFSEKKDVVLNYTPPSISPPSTLFKMKVNKSIYFILGGKGAYQQRRRAYLYPHEVGYRGQVVRDARYLGPRFHRDGLRGIEIRARV